MNKADIINSSLETSLRISLMLNQLFDIKLNADEIVLLDYYIIHLNDFDSTYDSIHPNIPNRENELLIRRKLVLDSINILESRSLINVNYTESGIRYSGNFLTSELSQNLESTYSCKLVQNISSIDTTKLDDIFQSVKTLINENSNLWVNETF